VSFRKVSIPEEEKEVVFDMWIILHKNPKGKD
jgi:hypothetical protein